MTFKVITEADAEREWHDAVNWYEEREPGAGLRLNDAIRAVLRSLAKQPGRFPRATRLTYKAKIPPPWPYSVYFTIHAEHREVKVLAVWHGARNPAELRRRLQ
ncbi:MAG TPA: type II toxin-antitoxin system RelE/ParE family toxin [Dongiaceae bacterium]|nr:type II toxin-antitoxin system RelE/ParE family toxin [Dongiaceae bacterium]